MSGSCGPDLLGRFDELASGLLELSVPVLLALALMVVRTLAVRLHLTHDLTHKAEGDQ